MSNLFTMGLIEAYPQMPADDSESDCFEGEGHGDCPYRHEFGCYRWERCVADAEWNDCWAIHPEDHPGIFKRGSEAARRAGTENGG